MIKIQSVKKPDVSYVLVGGKNYTVGRRNGDIVFPEDQSISRNHAEIMVKHPTANLTNLLLPPTVVVTDIGSKFGTFVNEGIERKTALSMREPMNLSNGDRFRFGLQWNEFRVEYTPLVMTSSTVKDTNNLKNIVSKLGAHLVAEWVESCQYVVMETLTLTIKAVCAILSAKQIVTPAFLEDLLECFQVGKSRFPNPRDFLPELQEKSLTSSQFSYEPNERRSTMFIEKTFLFASSKHLKKLSVAIRCGGGQFALVTAVSREELFSPDFLLIAPVFYGGLADKDTYNAIEYYRTSGKRVVQDSEIGMAALHCSTQRYCNPFHSFNDDVLPRTISQTQQAIAESRHVVPETQRIPSQLSSQPDCSGHRPSTSKTSGDGNVKSKSDLQRTKDQKEQSSSSNKRSVDAKRNMENKSQKGQSESKRRLASETETFAEPNPKRACKEKATPNRTLSDLFNLSDDEESSVNQLIPEDSVAQTQTQSGDKDSIHTTQFESVNITHEANTLSRKFNNNIQPTVELVPASPEQDIDEETLISDTNACKENCELVDSEHTNSESTMSYKRKHVPREESETGREKKRKLEVGKNVDRKNTRNTDTVPVERDLKLVIGKEERAKEIDIKPVPCLFVSMFKKPTEPQGCEDDISKTCVKNFKTFRKVLPLKLNVSQSKGNLIPAAQVKSFTFTEHTNLFRAPPMPNQTISRIQPRISNEIGEITCEEDVLIDVRNRMKSSSIGFSRQRSGKQPSDNESNNGMKAAPAASNTTVLAPLIFETEEKSEPAEENDIWAFD